MATIKIKKSEFKKLYDIACSSWKTKFDEKFKSFNFSETIDFDSSFLSEMQGACTDKQKPVFNKIFAKYLKETVDLFSIKTYKEVCKKLKEKELTINDFTTLSVEYRKKALAQAKLQQIEKLFNQDWIKDWSNRDQAKYYPWFEYKAGRGLVCCSYRGDSYYSDGSVAYFKDAKTAQFVGTTFIDLYKDII